MRLNRASVNSVERLVSEEFQGEGFLARSRGTSQGQPIGAVDDTTRLSARLLPEAVGEGFGELVGETAVEQFQRLGCVGARFPTRATGQECRGVERLQERETQVSLGDQVNRPPVVFGFDPGRPATGMASTAGSRSPGRPAPSRSARRPGVQPARDREHGVADLLRLEPAAIEPPQQAVLRIIARRPRRRRECDRLDCRYVPLKG